MSNHTIALLLVMLIAVMHVAGAAATMLGYAGMAFAVVVTGACDAVEAWRERHRR